MNGLKAQAPRLLKTVGNRPWARRSDHEQDGDTKDIAKERRKSTNVDAAPRRSSDIEADPVSSSDDDMPVSSADIPASFDAHGRSLRTSDPERGLSRRQKNNNPAGVTGDTFESERPRKLQRLSDDEDIDMFGEVRRKRPQPGATGSNRIRSVPGLTYAKPNPQLKGFVSPPASLSSQRHDSQANFKRQFLPAVRPGRDSGVAKKKKSGYTTESDHIKGPGRQGSSRSRQAGNPRKGKVGVTASLAGGSSPSPAPAFKVVESLTQAVHKFDPAELEREREEERREAERRAAATNLYDDGPCPMQCGKILPRRVLETLSTAASIKEQQSFCRKHQIEDAKQSWAQRGFPNIDWDQLPKRLGQYNGRILKMITDPDRLQFRNEMIKRNTKGKDRTLLQQMNNEGFEGIGVGYYGPRGFVSMTDHIMKNFAAEIRERAAGDKVIAARGPTGYVQMVLVLELAALLVGEDMNVNGAEARAIMSESTGIGDLLHPRQIGAKRRSSRVTSLAED